MGTEVVANLANAFDQFRCVFEIAQAQLTRMKETADETTLELSAKLTTNGNLLIVQGSAEGAIKVTMKWKKPPDKKTSCWTLAPRDSIHASMSQHPARSRHDPAHP